MITSEALQAYTRDDGLRIKELLRKDEFVQKIKRVKENEEWSKSELYTRPTKIIEDRRKKFSLLAFIKQFIP